MTNEPGSRKALDAAKRMLKEKGYYIVLLLCIVAVGISGYVFIRTAISAHRGGSTALAPDAGSTLDVPLTAREPETGAAADAAAEAGSAQDAAVTAMTDAEVSAAAARTVIRPVAGETIAAYSMDALVYNETMADWRTHSGIDIQAAEGDSVKTAANGKVVKVEDDELMGTTVVIEHAGGYSTQYSCLQKDPPVTVGQEVAAGDVIGQVGSTASAETEMGAHLHFSVSKDGKVIDPSEYVGD